MTEYFIIDSSGHQVGPIAESRLSEYNIEPGTLVWHLGMDQWKPAGELNELRPYFETRIPPAPPTPAPTPPPFTPDYAPQAAPQPVYINNWPCPPTHMVLSVVGLVFSVLLLFRCIGIIPLIFSAIALSNAQKVEPYWRSGFYDKACSASKKARLWGWLSILFFPIFVILLFVIVLIFAIPSAVLLSAFENL